MAFAVLNYLRTISEAGEQAECINMEGTLSEEQTLHGSSRDQDLICIGYRESFCRKMVFYIAIICFVGIPLFIEAWKKHWKIQLTCYKCPLHLAKFVILKNYNDEIFVEKVIEETVNLDTFPAEFIVDPIENMTNANAHEYQPIDRITRYFLHQKIKFVWNQGTHSFHQLRGLNCKVITILGMHKGLSAKQQKGRQHLYGMNAIEVEVKSYFRLLVDEVLHPFYVFQAFSIILWCTDDYYYYAACIFLISSFSLGITVCDLKKQSISLRDTVASNSGHKISVVRNCGVCEEIDSSQLVPGDVIELPSTNFIMSCDAVLLGGVCIVNESMLTGESIPVTKTAMPLLDEMYSSESHKRHTLFSGTEIIQTRYFEQNKVLAVVVSTGFSTAKGELVRTIMHPTPLDFLFYRDSLYFILIMFAFAAIGIAFSLYLYVIRHVAAGDIVIRVLDIVTVVVPPALPAAMTIGIVYAQSRLRKSGLFCISPSRINVAGKVKLICFDKTGTLTEDGLDMRCVVPVQENIFFLPITTSDLLDNHTKLLQCMATCHSLTRIHGKISGDPLDLRMFEFTGWVLEEPKQFDTLMPVVVHPPKQYEHVSNYDPGSGIEISYELGIVHQFPFSSTLQRMSVITRTLGANHFELYCKGSPEIIKSLCLPHTVPSEFGNQLKDYALQGFRVLALGYRSFTRKLQWHQLPRMPREQAETELTFLGLLVMQNNLKPESAPIIHELRNANLRCIMLTGDNLLTAVSVARECGLISETESVALVTSHTPSSLRSDDTTNITQNVINCPYLDYEWLGLHSSDANFNRPETKTSYQEIHLAMTGHTWSTIRNYFSHLLPYLLLKITVLARMSPEEKAQVIQELQKLGYVVAMCGDGANDCSALKTAHVGVSLSEAEASVAAPFTSRISNISCIPTIIREGRCALVTSFGAFKYMALYSIIQFVSVILLYMEGSMLGDAQNLWLDLVLVTVAAILMGRFGPQTILSNRQPQGRLIATRVLCSLIGQMFLVGLIQVVALVLLKIQPWYVPVDAGSTEGIVLCWENTTLFAVSSFQYLVLAVVFSEGKPFRKPFYSDILFLGAILLLTVMSVILIVYPGKVIASFFELEILYTPSKMYFLYTLLLLSAFHCVAAMVFEKIVIPNSCMKSFYHWTSRNHPQNHYKQIQFELSSNNSWPVPGQRDYAACVNHNYMI